MAGSSFTVRVESGEIQGESTVHQNVVLYGGMVNAMLDFKKRSKNVGPNGYAKITNLVTGEEQVVRG